MSPTSRDDNICSVTHLDLYKMAVFRIYHQLRVLDHLSESSSSDEEEVEDDFIVYDESSDEEEVQHRFGGYEYEFVDNVADNQKCPVCLLPMRDAVQTSECGHRFCEDCLNGILRNDHPVCPNDRREIQGKGGFFLDKAWTRDILGLRVKCKQSARGCDWIGQLRHAKGHEDECPYEDEECSGCDDKIQRRLLETHLNEECPKRIVECVYCQDEFTFVQKQEHEDMYCRRFPLVCSNNCGREGIPRQEMDSHLSKKCPMTEVTCPYAEAGCPFQDKRAYFNEHMEASIDDHLELTWSSLVATKQDLDSMKDLPQKFHEVQEDNQKLRESVADCRKKIRDLSLTTKVLEDVVKKILREKKSAENKMLQSHVSHLRRKIRKAPPRYDGDDDDDDDDDVSTTHGSNCRGLEEPGYYRQLMERDGKSAPL